MLLSNKKLKTFTLRLFPVIELFVWLSFIIWSSSVIFGNFTAYPVIMTVVIIIIIATLAWYLFRDFVSGFILRLENGFEPGQVIKTSLAQGTIKKVGYRSIEIITSNGESVKIPYTLLMNRSVIKPQDNSKWVENVLNIEFTTALDVGKVKNMLKLRLMEMPWIVSEESLKLQIKAVNSASEETLRQYYVTIYFYSITPEFVIKTQENLKQFIDEKII